MFLLIIQQIKIAEQIKFIVKNSLGMVPLSSIFNQTNWLIWFDQIVDWHENGRQRNSYHDSNVWVIATVLSVGCSSVKFPIALNAVHSWPELDTILLFNCDQFNQSTVDNANFDRNRCGSHKRILVSGMPIFHAACMFRMQFKMQMNADKCAGLCFIFVECIFRASAQLNSSLNCRRHTFQPFP